ncbi:hypothetical protein [Streptomyces sp. NPDC052042]|uniref:hypothetical protein n=1 Tax=Streptomyces sp. NPDC052042 TaxID=3365683 RepID=UPI0037D5CC79
MKADDIDDVVLAEAVEHGADGPYGVGRVVAGHRHLRPGLDRRDQLVPQPRPGGAL